MRWLELEAIEKSIIAGWNNDFISKTTSFLVYQEEFVSEDLVSKISALTSEDRSYYFEMREFPRGSETHLLLIDLYTYDMSIQSGHFNSDISSFFKTLKEKSVISTSLFFGNVIFFLV